MSRDFDTSGSVGSEPEVSATGGLPADFFEKPDRVAAAPPVRVVAGDRPLLPVVGAVLLGAALMFLSGVLSGWALARKDVAPPPPIVPPGPDPFAKALARSVDTKASGADVEDVKAKLDGLARRIDQLQDRIDAQPAPDLAPLRAGLDELAKASERLAPLPERLQTLDERIGAIDEAVGSLRLDLGSLREQAKAAVSPPPRSEPAVSGPGDADASDRERTRAVELFQKREYAQARDAFLRLAKETLDDARLWYYAALANGFATGDWRGETERLVRRGLDCERAGTPDRDRIDAAFAKLAEERGGQWLRGWRKQAAGR